MSDIVETKEELIGKLYALRAGLSVISVENDGIIKERFAADKINTSIAQKKEIVRRDKQKPIVLPGYEYMPITRRENEIRRNEERIEECEKILQGSQEGKKGLYWGAVIRLFFAIAFFLVSFSCTYWCVLAIITDIGGYLGFVRLLGMMEKSKGITHLIQLVYCAIDKRVVVRGWQYNAGKSGLGLLLFWLIPCILAIVCLVFGIKFTIKFFRNIRSSKEEKERDKLNNERARQRAQREKDTLTNKNRELRIEVEKLKEQTKGEDEREFFLAIYREKEELLLKEREYKRNAKLKEIALLEKDVQEKREGISEHLKKTKEYCDKLVETYQDFLDIRDWDKIDYLIYLVETNRAKSISEGLNLVDTKIWQEDMRRETKELKEIGNQVIKTINTGLGNIYNVMVQGFSVIHKDILDMRMDNLKIGKALLESSYRQEQLSNEQNIILSKLKSAVAAKASTPSLDLANVARDIHQMRIIAENHVRR